MPSITKSKPKSKSTSKATKNQSSKISMKPSTVYSNRLLSDSSATAHSPAMRASPAMDTPPYSSPGSQKSARFINVEDPEDHSGSSSPATTAEYDTSSNTGSCSGESEDQKEKPAGISPRTETIFRPCNGKIRQKNERKHQRQKEKRSQELHERCIAFLTSRKLEFLSHQLVAMGFPADRATMAIIANDGRMEESVAWLLHDGDEHDDKQQPPANLYDQSCIKIDISDELRRVAELEVQYKCSRQEVERVIVVCEGELLKVEEALKRQKQAVSMKLNDTPNNLKSISPDSSSPESAKRISVQQSSKRSQPKPANLPKLQGKVIDKMWTASAPVSLVSQVTRAAREPVVVMQRPKQKLPLPPASSGRYCSGGGFEIPQMYAQNNLRPLPSVSEGLSLGLFSGWGLPCPSESPSRSDWNTCGSTHIDYASIDWSLDPAPRRPSMKIDTVPETWSPMFAGRTATRLENSIGSYLRRDISSSGGLVEWRSPFEGRDLFRVSRQFVTSPSM